MVSFRQIRYGRFVRTRMAYLSAVWLPVSVENANLLAKMATVESDLVSAGEIGGEQLLAGGGSA
jgi:hypothetical protein